MRGIATFKVVAAGDGSPQSPSGYSYYLLAHAIATVLLLIGLVAAVWQFMDWVVTPSCLGGAPLSSVSSVGPPPSVISAASQHYSARVEVALTGSECRCPHQR